MEGQPMVSYSTGSMNSLLHKLTKLKNRPDLIHELQQDLKSLEELIDRLVQRLATDEQVKEWMKQVRELFHDIEDWIDLNPEMNLGHTEREEIEDFKTQIQEAHGRCTRYGLLDKAPTAYHDFAPSKVTIYSRPVFEEKTCLVGVEDRRNDLGKHLTDKHVKMLKVVFIVGAEGLGKTTLAKEIYAEFKGQFDCQAFVSLGRRPSVRKTLQDILRQVNPLTFESPDLQQAISMLRECLHTKRYFIVIDGVWSTWAWKVINCALPDTDSGSRVLATTCIPDVAKSCCSDVIYQMEALKKDESRRLFRSRIHIGEFDDNNMLTMCSGIPLAITIAAGLLGRKSVELAEPEVLEKYILSASDQYSTSEGIRMVLHMSYADLPASVKSCFLYLGVFPEDYTIRKDRVIRLWEAEGLTSRTGEDKERSWGTGVSYFNELINRGLIQSVFDFDDDQAEGCTVHGVILDFIRSLSREDNFSTTVAELISDPSPCDAIRRFSLDRSNEDEANTLKSNSVHLSSMRSLTVFGDAEGLFDPPDPPSDSEEDENNKLYARWDVGSYRNLLLSFELIRVLDLEDTKNLNDHDLKSIVGLVLLRYLGLGGTGIRRLPEEIGNLKQLETLDVRRNMLYHLPASLFELKRLVHLLLHGYHRRIHQILVKMQELEELSNIHVISSSTLSSVAELLSKSKRLRILGVKLDESFAREADILISFLKVVVNSGLHSLSIHCCSYSGNDEFVGLLVDLWEKVTAPSVTSQLQRDVKQTSQLQRFELRISNGPIRRVPRNMSSLVSLTHLHIEFCQLGAEDLHVLGGLRNLVLLNLSTDIAPGGFRIIKKGLFPSLKVFSFTRLYWSTCGLEFAEGAMPQLRRLRLSLYPEQLRDIVILYLTGLVRIHATIDCYRATASEVEAAEAYIRSQVSKNPNRPTLELSRADVSMMKDEELSRADVSMMKDEELSRARGGMKKDEELSRARGYMKKDKELSRARGDMKKDKELSRARGDMKKDEGQRSNK